MNDKPKELEEHSAKIFELGCMERPVYLKEDVDAVIAELKADYKEACDRLQTANLIKDEQIAATRHQKYKRSLAMMRWCASRASVWFNNGDENRATWYWKWYDRWFDIIEQFKDKEAK